MATEIGIIKALIGTVTATATDGTVRNLQIGDKIYQNDLITTGAAGAVEIEFLDGTTMDMGRSTQAILDLDVFDPSAPVTETAETTDVPDDIAALQQALLAGEDVSVAGEATAAGAGTAGDGSEGGSSFVVRNYLNPEVTPDNGFDTTGPSILLETPEELNLIVEEETTTPVVPPVVSVSVDVEIDIEDPQSPPPEDGIPTPEYPVLVNGNAASVLEGTSDGNKVVVFVINLSAPFAQDVTVTYSLYQNGFADPSIDPDAGVAGEDWIATQYTNIEVIIPAGSTQIFVPVSIVEDRIDEGNGEFLIVLESATNATINPDANSATVTIYDDDTTPVAVDDENTLVDNGDVYEVSGNVLTNDTDEDGDDEPGNGLLEVVIPEGETEIVIPHQYGTLTIEATGAYTFELNQLGIDYLTSLGEGVEGEITFPDAYQVSDGVNTGNMADVIITLVGINDLADGNEINSTDEDTTLTVLDGAEGDLLNNVIDPDGPNPATITQFVVAGDATVYNPGETAEITGVGSLTINANGSYTFVPAANYNGPVPQVTYSVTDGEDTVQSTLDLSVDLVNDAPEVTTDSVVISEEGLLALGANQDDEGDLDTTNLASANGQVTATDADGDSLTFTLNSPPVLTSGGVAVEWTGTGTNTLTGSVGGTTIIVIAIGSDGAWSATLEGPIDHPDTTVEDDLTFDVGVTVSDGTVGVPATISVTVEDDAPVLEGFSTFTGINAIPNVLGTYSGTYEGGFGADGIGSIELLGTPTIEGLSFTSSVDPDTGVLTITATTVSTGNDYFQVVVNTDGTYQVELLGERPTTETTVAFGSVQGGQAVQVLTIGDVTFVSGSPGGTIKPSSNGFGVDGNNNFDGGESFTMTVVGQLVDSVSITHNHQGSGTMTYSWVTDTGEEGFTAVNSDGEIIFNPNESFSSITFTASATGSASAKIDGVSYTQEVLPDTQSINFDIALEDGDGDQDEATLTFELSGSSQYTGTSGDDSITGGSGDDVIVGSGGNDILTGGDGADLFVFNDADMGDAVTPAEDEITDFSEAEGDVIDLSDVLANGDNTIAGFESDGHLQIQVSNNGQVVQTIDVNSIAVADNAAAQTALNNMLSSGAVDDGV